MITHCHDSSPAHILYSHMARIHYPLTTTYNEIIQLLTSFTSMSFHDQADIIINLVVVIVE